MRSVTRFLHILGVVIVEEKNIPVFYSLQQNCSVEQSCWIVSSKVVNFVYKAFKCHDCYVTRKKKV